MLKWQGDPLFSSWPGWPRGRGAEDAHGWVERRFWGVSAGGRPRPTWRPRPRTLCASLWTPGSASALRSRRPPGHCCTAARGRGPPLHTHSGPANQWPLPLHPPTEQPPLSSAPLTRATPSSRTGSITRNFSTSWPSNGQILFYFSPKMYLFLKSVSIFLLYKYCEGKLYLSKQMDPDLSTPIFMEFHFTLAEIYS